MKARHQCRRRHANPLTDRGIVLGLHSNLDRLAELRTEFSQAVSKRLLAIIKLSGHVEFLARWISGVVFDLKALWLAFLLPPMVNQPAASNREDPTPKVTSIELLEPPLDFTPHRLRHIFGILPASQPSL